MFFSTDVQSTIKEAGIVFASVDTPTKIRGVGAGHSSRVCQLRRDIIEKTAVPVKTIQEEMQDLFLGSVQEMVQQLKDARETSSHLVEPHF